MIVFTSDMDWVPEEVLADTLGLFQKYNIKCTIFATNASKELEQCNQDLFEIGIHPNFNGLLAGQEGSIHSIIEPLMNLFPDSKGVRSHSLTQNSHILSAFVEYGLLYDVNQFRPYSKGLEPFQLWNNLVRIPFNWADDVHCGYNMPHINSGLDISGDEMNVFLFHPIHIFLNTESTERYEAAKKYYHEPKKLVDYRNTKTKGTRTLLIDLLEYSRENKIKNKKAKDIVLEWKKEKLQ